MIGTNQPMTVAGDNSYIAVTLKRRASGVRA